MKGVGEAFPEFSLNACVGTESGHEFDTITEKTFQDKWKVYFFWPLDFTFVCPTEITGFAELNGDFAAKDCQLLGCSTDSHYSHLAWRNSNAELKNLPFPMLADMKRELCAELGILDAKLGAAQRATYVVDNKNIIRHVTVNDLGIGRNPQETLRVVDALKTGKLTPCNWQPGQATLN